MVAHRASAARAQALWAQAATLPARRAQRDALSAPHRLPVRMLPGDFPKWYSVYHYFAQWRDHGTIEWVHDRLRDQARKATVRGAVGNIDWGSDLDKDGNPIPGAVRWKSDGVKATALRKDDKGNPKTGNNNEDYTTDDVKGPDGKKLANGTSVWP